MWRPIAEDRQRQNQIPETHRRRQRKMNISPEQLQQHKNSLQLTIAEIDLQEKELATWKARGEAERNLYSWIADVSADPTVKRTPLRVYQDAHKAHYAA